MSELFVHLVWATARREPLIDGAAAARLYAMIAANCRELRCTPSAVGGLHKIPDEPHLQRSS